MFLKLGEKEVFEKLVFTSGNGVCLTRKEKLA